MKAGNKKHNGSAENLLGHALVPTMRLPIAVALDGAMMTYGTVKSKLEVDAGFSTSYCNTDWVFSRCPYGKNPETRSCSTTHKRLGGQPAGWSAE